MVGTKLKSVKAEELPCQGLAPGKTIDYITKQATGESEDFAPLVAAPVTPESCGRS